MDYTIKFRELEEAFKKMGDPELARMLHEYKEECVNGFADLWFLITEVIKGFP